MYENNDKAQSTRRPKGSKGCFKILLKHTRLEDRKNRKDVLKLCQSTIDNETQEPEACIKNLTKHGRLGDHKEQRDVSKLGQSTDD